MQHLVVVDDAATNVEILSAIVGDIAGVEVHGFTSSQDALAWSKANTADAFLLDYNMPAPDGLALIRLLRADERYRLVPMVIVTSEHEHDVRLAALAAGANDFIERPIERREVLSRMRTLLSLQAERAGLESSLAAEERRSRAQAARLETLLRVANASYDPRSEDAIQVVLDEASAAIRPAQPFFGSLLRIDGDDVVLTATARSEAIARATPGLMSIGDRVPLEGLPLRLAVRSGMTLSWDDCSIEPGLADLPIVRTLALRAQICTPFVVGAHTYVLVFSSTEPADDPFASDDHTYVGLLADFFAKRLQLAEQSQRLAQQADRLTALLRVANATYDPDREDSVQEVLSEGAAAIRPGQEFYGALMRVEEGRCVMIAAARPDDLQRQVPATAPVGAYVPVAEMAEQFAVYSGSAVWWDDVLSDPRCATLPRVAALGERALIAATFNVGRETYLLSFASRTPNPFAFDDDDGTYLKLLADFFATRMQRAQDSNKLLHHMSHDILTGLRNRTQFRLDARRQLHMHHAGAVAVVALDDFRAINGEFGHIIGDALLVEVGAALERAVGMVGITGRLAGDTFGVFLNGITNEDDAARRVAHLQHVFTKPFSTGDREGKEFIPLGATIGVALSEGTADTIDQLLARADIAVFSAKQRGRGNVEFFRRGMESEASTRARMAAEISHAIENDEFELHIQPHLDLQTMSVSGAEALIRWNHPTFGLVAPGAFIPFAERHGLIRAVTRWVMRAALTASRTLCEIDPGFRLYFNLSAVDFNDASIVHEFHAAARRGIDLGNIGVELTETAAMQDPGAAARTVRQLQDLGVSVAIDDFGTGHSSLALLRRVAANIIKIDRSFVNETVSGGREAAIADIVIGGGPQLGYETVGEGVETREQLDWLRSHGCRYVQGYAVAEPKPLDAFVTWMRSGALPAAIA